MVTIKSMALNDLGCILASGITGGRMARVGPNAALPTIITPLSCPPFLHKSRPKDPTIPSYDKNPRFEKFYPHHKIDPRDQTSKWFVSQDFFPATAVSGLHLQCMGAPIMPDTADI